MHKLARVSVSVDDFLGHLYMIYRLYPSSKWKNGFLLEYHSPRFQWPHAATALNNLRDYSLIKLFIFWPIWIFFKLMTKVFSSASNWFSNLPLNLTKTEITKKCVIKKLLNYLIYLLFTQCYLSYLDLSIYNLWLINIWNDNSDWIMNFSSTSGSF